MRDIFVRDDQRLELMAIIFEIRNDNDTQQTHANFEDSIAVLNNEVPRFIFKRIFFYRYLSTF